MAERNMVNLTITMTKEERKALKQIALDKDMTVSALVREWLKERTPKDIANCVIHNDWRFDNVVLSEQDPT